MRRRLRCRADWPSLPARRTAKLSRRRRAHPRRALRSTPPHPPGRGPTGAGGHHQPRRRRSGDRHHVSGRVHGHDVRRLGPPTHLHQHPAGQVADTSTTSYDKLGQVTKVTDNTGEARYTYGGADANGQVETRGLVTRVEQTSGGVTHSSAAAYDAQGKVTLEKLPGGITRRHSWDPAGELVDLVYSGRGTDPDTGNSVDDQPWFGWSATTDAAGRTVREWSTDGGSAYTTTGAQAVQSDRYYRYDKAGRLTRVDDVTGNPDTSGAVPCTRRGYGFDTNGNRTSQTTAINPSCGDPGQATMTRAYNGADQPVTGVNGQGTYTYDLLGRQTTIPASDTANPGRGDMTLGYYDTDAAQSISQGDVRVTFTLDGAGRRLVQNTTAGPVVVPGAETGSVVRHYTDSWDNPDCRGPRRPDHDHQVRRPHR